MAVAAALHGSVGLGMALVAAPLLILIDPALVPAPIIVNALVLLLAMVIRERSDIVVGEVSWAVLGCTVGTAGAATLLLVIPSEAFSLVFGFMLLAGVAISIVRWSGSPGPLMEFGAGALSGLMGTTTSIGGPPLALAYQNYPAAKLRGQLSVYFLAAGVLALGGLFVADRFGLKEIRLSAYLIPGTLLGLLISNKTRKWLRSKYVRPAVLTLCTVAAVLILVRYFW